MNRIPLNDLGRRDGALEAELCDAAARVVRSGWYLMGPERRAFEVALGEHLGGRSAIGVSTGTDALALALLAVGCAPGDEVVTAANAGMYTSVAALGVGLTPRYADVDPATLCLSANTVAEAITSATRAVVVTHLYGRLAAIEPIVELCRDNGIAVVEDCAQAIGARRGSRVAGAFGDASAFSFYPTKNLGALGDAGAVAAADPEIEHRVRRLSQYGWDQKYRVSDGGGRNSRMDELQAAFLLVELPHLAARNARRRSIAQRYAAALDPALGRMAVTEDEDYVAHLAVVVAADRAGLSATLDAAGIATDVHYPIPDHRQPVWDGRLADVCLPVTEDLAGRVLTLPCFPELGDDEVDRVCEVLRGL
jgi:dTDP-3-amino-2,3,6-trideoxy-4-keto-D-glucose/dTDP-3-amino-3,4,6-trideoxy-alpha-D-glucose/dTDP-2,6-dideoxy-D-kanosamine transaminase